MSANSKIEWTHHTFNPWWGCTKVSAGCANCYAESTANRYGMKVWGDNADRRFFGDKHWLELIKWNAAAEQARERHRVFCASMADVYEARPELPPHRRRLMHGIDLCPWLDFLLLTKRPENILPLTGQALTLEERGGDDAITAGRRWLEARKNVWLLTSVEDQPTADQRIPELLKAPAVVHGLSMEPLLGPVQLAGRYTVTNGAGIDWVIAGGESGPKARPMHPDWPRQLRDQCTAAGVPFFFKQWGEFRPLHAEDNPTHFVCQECGFVGPIRNDDDGTAEAIARHRGGGCRGSTHPLIVGKKAAGRQLDGREWNEFPRGVA